MHTAISDCNSIMTVQLSSQRAMTLDADDQGEWGSAVTSECTSPGASGRRRLARIGSGEGHHGFADLAQRMGSRHGVSPELLADPAALAQE